MQRHHSRHWFVASLVVPALVAACGSAGRLPSDGSGEAGQAGSGGDSNGGTPSDGGTPNNSGAGGTAARGGSGAAAGENSAGAAGQGEGATPGEGSGMGGESNAGAAGRGDGGTAGESSGGAGGESSGGASPTCEQPACDVHANCELDEGAPRCVCKPGFEGDGEHCTDIDECGVGNGGCEPPLVCLNVPGGMGCGACPPGFTGDDATGCTDIDECATNHGGCDARSACVNLPGSRLCAAPKSCADLRRLIPASESGVHWLNPGNGWFQAYCDMSTQGGGWTLALKIDGRLRTFSYDAALWTNRALLNASAPAFDHTEAKLETFNRVAFTNVLLEMEHPLPGTRRVLRVPHAAASLYDVFRSGAHVPVTPLGRDAWKGLLGPSASLQEHCNREGFNVVSDETPAMYTRVRFGILSNQEDDCVSGDSYIGVGGLLNACLAGAAPVAGGSAGCNPDSGDGHFPAFAWLLVR